MPVQQALSDAKAVVSAVEQGEYTTARGQLESFTEAVNDVTVRESGRKARAVAARDQTSPQYDGADTLDTFLSAHSSIQFARAGFVITAQGLITDPESGGVADLRSALDSFVDQEEAYVSATESVEPVISSVSIPGQPDILSASVPTGVQPKGTTFDLTTVVGNVGNEPVDDVQVVGSVDGPVSLDPDTYAIETIESRSQVERVFTATADDVGEATLSVGIQGENGPRRRKDVSIEVKGKQEFIETVRTALIELSDELSSRQGRTQPYRAKITNAVSKVEDAQAAIDRGQAKQANNMLNAASRILGALLNQLADAGGDSDGSQGEQGSGKGKGKGKDGETGKGSSQSNLELVQTLRAEAETRIDQIQLAIEAEV